MQAGLGGFTQRRELQDRLVGIIHLKVRILGRVIEPCEIDCGTLNRHDPANTITEKPLLEDDGVIHDTGKHHERQNEQKRSDQGLTKSGSNPFRQALHVRLKRLKVNNVDQRDIGNRCRQESMLDDFRIRNADIFHHQEGRSPHDRRHDLTIDRGSHFDCPGFFTREANALHQRNGKGTGRHNIGNRGPGNKTRHCR